MENSILMIFVSTFVLAIATNPTDNQKELIKFNTPYAINYEKICFWINVPGYRQLQVNEDNLSKMMCDKGNDILALGKNIITFYEQMENEVCQKSAEQGTCKKAVKSCMNNFHLIVLDTTNDDKCFLLEKMLPEEKKSMMEASKSIDKEIPENSALSKLKRGFMNWVEKEIDEWRQTVDRLQDESEEIKTDIKKHIHELKQEIKKAAEEKESKK